MLSSLVTRLFALFKRECVSFTKFHWETCQVFPFQGLTGKLEYSPRGKKRHSFELPIAVIMIYCHRKQGFHLFFLYDFVPFFFQYYD